MTTQITALSPAGRHRVVAAGFADQIAAVTNWDATAPVDGWTARDVVGHLIGWFPAFLADGGVQLPAGPSVDDDPGAAWAAQSATLQVLLDGPAADDEFTHSMAGRHRLGDAVDRFFTADVFMHTWDLAAAAGTRPDLDPEFATQLLDGMPASRRSCGRRASTGRPCRSPTMPIRSPV